MLKLFKNFKGAEVSAIIFFKWILISVISGLLVGAIGTAFHFLLEHVTLLRQKYNWLIFLLPLGGIIIALSYKLLGMSKDKGTNSVLVAVRDNDELNIKTMFLVFGSTIITHLFGGSSGREGAALQIGGCLSAQLGRIIKLDEKDERIITMCGMSAGFASLFGTPLTAAIFAMEVTSVGVMYYSSMVPCIIAALVGASVSAHFGILPTHFNIIAINGMEAIPQLSILNIIKVIIIAMLCAALSVLFCISMHKSHHYYRKFLLNKIPRAAAGGIIIVILTYIVGTYDYNGAGMEVINRAFEGTAKQEAFILKLVFTAITLGAGFKGGEIVPVFFVGSTFGNVISKVLNMNPSFGTGLGLVSVFCGVTNCPITSIFMSIELFGANGLMFFAVACAISYMLSGYEGLYSEQKIVYSKLKPVFIDKKVGQK